MKLLINDKDIKKIEQSIDLDLFAEKITRAVALTCKAVLEERVFASEGGRKTDGSLIGVYSKAYYARRVKEKGRTNKDINLTYTGQMFQDLSVGVGDNGSYTVGFQNQFNADKAGWMEERFGTIFQISENEMNDFIQPVVDEMIGKALNGKI